MANGQAVSPTDVEAAREAVCEHDWLATQLGDHSKPSEVRAETTRRCAPTSVLASLRTRRRAGGSSLSATKELVLLFRVQQESLAPTELITLGSPCSLRPQTLVSNCTLRTRLHAVRCGAANRDSRRLRRSRMRAQEAGGFDSLDFASMMNSRRSPTGECQLPCAGITSRTKAQSVHRVRNLNAGHVNSNFPVRSSCDNELCPLLTLLCCPLLTLLCCPLHALLCCPLLTLLFCPLRRRDARPHVLVPDVLRGGAARRAQVPAARDGARARAAHANFSAGHPQRLWHLRHPRRADSARASAQRADSAVHSARPFWRDYARGGYSRGAFTILVATSRRRESRSQSSLASTVLTLLSSASTGACPTSGDFAFTPIAYCPYLKRFFCEYLRRLHRARWLARLDNTAAHPEPYPPSDLSAASHLRDDAVRCASPHSRHLRRRRLRRQERAQPGAPRTRACRPPLPRHRTCRVP
eukprot:4074008-Pleurochrysis_carterae.AAC.2